MRFFDGEEAPPAAPAGDGAAAAPADAGGAGNGTKEEAPTTQPPVHEPEPMPNHPKEDGAGEAPSTEAPSNSTAPFMFEQSSAWLLHLVVLVAAMTMLFPFLRNLMGIKRTKRQVVNYSSYDSGDEDDDDEDSEGNCEDLQEYFEED